MECDWEDTDEGHVTCIAEHSVSRLTAKEKIGSIEPCFHILVNKRLYRVPPPKTAAKVSTFGKHGDGTLITICPEIRAVADTGAARIRMSLV